jgi:hypothetical protein
MRQRSVCLCGLRFLRTVLRSRSNPVTNTTLSDISKVLLAMTNDFLPDPALPEPSGISHQGNLVLVRLAP